MNALECSAHILIVDDDPKIRLLLRRCFEPEGYLVSEAESREEVISQLAEQDFSLITLDLNLGRDDGLTVARDVRERCDVPIIMVTGKGDMVDRVVGLELGADDYIAKPFHVREVLARVRSVLRRSHATSQTLKATEQKAAERYSFDGWVADFTRLELQNPDGNPCDLTTSELQLLEVFVQRPNRVLTRDQLMDLLKGQHWNANDRSIDNQIARLRKKIEADPKNPRYLKTVRGLGYNFTAEVDRN